MIQATDRPIKELKQDIEKVIQRHRQSNENLKLEEKSIKEATQLLLNSELWRNMRLMEGKEFLDSFDYRNLSEIEESLTFLQGQIKRIKEEIDITKFMRDGKVFDFAKLKKQAERKGLRRVFKRFSLRRLEELINNPLLEIENYAGEKITYDPFIVKKLNIAIIQMIFNDMDFYIINYGEEGSGKSCWSSQLLLYMYTVLKEVGLVEYAYKIEEMFFSSIERLLEKQEEQRNDDYFRLMTLDEAYDLNRQNFREETSMIYKDDMRSARKLRRINQLNLPQLGELDTTITLSRTNFIFNCRMDNQPTLGTLKKGVIDMYVVPRGPRIYSPFHKKNLPKGYIKQTLAKKLEKKSEYYLEMPKELIVHRFEFEDKWGFDPMEYQKHIKSENKQKRFSKGQIKTSDFVGYILLKKMPELKHWGTFNLKDKKDKKMYNTLKTWQYQIKNRFFYDPDKLKRFEIHYDKDM